LPHHSSSNAARLITGSSSPVPAKGEIGVLWVWLVLAVVLVSIELRHLAFYAMFVAAGAVAAALVAAFAPESIAVQGVVFVGVAVAGVAAIRPYISKAYERRHPSGEVVRGVHGGLVGQRAITLDVVGDAHHVGHVQLAGERWLAVRMAGAMIPAHTPVVVTAVQGTTLSVAPIDDIRTASSNG
jgi:membrane protein implicated in regulation of membrane protease activity